MLICDPAVKAQLLFCKKVKVVPRKVGLFQDSSGAAAPPPGAVLSLQDPPRAVVISTQKSASSCLLSPSLLHSNVLAVLAFPSILPVLLEQSLCEHLQPGHGSLGLQAPPSCAQLLWPCWDAGMLF